MSNEQIQYIFVLAVVCMVNSINVNVFPEFLNNNHFAGVQECDIPCEYFENHTNPDAEFYIAMNDGNIQSYVDRHSKVPIRILGSNEPQHYYHLMKLEYLKHHFQGSCLLDRKSDIPWVLMRDMEKMRKVDISKGAQPKVTFVARNCNAFNNRNVYVTAIDAKVGVVAMGSCLNNAAWPDCKGTSCSKVDALRPYKIHLAFENGDSPGFVTDKIYHAFEAGVLPVWMGTRDVAETVPKGSYIDVAEFNTPDDVANYLKLVLENETLYNSYFEWKNKPLDPEYVRNNKVLWSEGVFCRACHYVDSLQRGLEWDHVRQRAKHTGAHDNISSIDLSVNFPNEIITPVFKTNYLQESNGLLYVLIIVCMVLFLLFRRSNILGALLRNFYRK